MNEVDGLLRPLLLNAFPWLHLESWFYAESYWWTFFGLLGNGIFASRFIIQWIISEKKKQVVIPPIFWHLSFWGSIILLIYFIRLDKLPPILGTCFLPILYGRNLILLYRKKSHKSEDESSDVLIP
ncbi:MAG: lipid-A-disaccharide synthase N-terminal domain-containing protein [Methylacidiphilales bacterium]|nr:lipid-A-disaccharide synthase N-terminal domain-containing protein [Candidatus Methylacidiphilales bacterium]MDW8348645.1 lipid-A-disaccharide synthase N-terminal domain-containing protein [Verrucomicrobiae bacterium]